MRRFLALGLLVLLLAAALPVVMSMGADEPCPQCVGTLAVAGLCLAVLAGLAISRPRVGSPAALMSNDLASRLIALRLDRPPRSSV